MVEDQKVLGIRAAEDLFAGKVDAWIDEFHGLATWIGKIDYAKKIFYFVWR